jgi:hypothetical protein
LVVTWFAVLSSADFVLISQGFEETLRPAQSETIASDSIQSVIAVTQFLAAGTIVPPMDPGFRFVIVEENAVDAGFRL